MNREPRGIAEPEVSTYHDRMSHRIAIAAGNCETLKAENGPAPRLAPGFSWPCHLRHLRSASGPARSQMIYYNVHVFRAIYGYSLY